MDDNLAILLLMVFAIWSAVGLVVLTKWSRKGRLPGHATAGDLPAARQIELLSNENESLRGQLSRLEERVGTLERR